MRTRHIAALTVALIGFVPAAASPAATVATVGIGGSGDAGVQATSFTHRDCVGLGVPGTTIPHTTHTNRVTGFVIGAGVVNFAVQMLNPFGSGICPTALGGPVLEEDFTGTYHMTAICRLTQNSGAVFLEVVIEAVAGLVQSQGSQGTPCVGQSGARFELDITVEISDTSLFGIPLEPLGGVKLTVTQ